MKRIAAAKTIHPLYKELNSQWGKTPRCLFAGDDDVDRAAPYVLSMMHQAGVTVDYVCSMEVPSSNYCSSETLKGYDWIILSDFPPLKEHESFFRAIVEAVAQGTNFTMIGGWESFNGNGDYYRGTPIEEMLPVTLDGSDDRNNTWQGILLEQAGPLPLAENTKKAYWDSLEWDRPAVVAGCNMLTPKANSQVLLNGRPMVINQTGGAYSLETLEAIPLLVALEHGKGRVSALAFDMAPHWVAGGVDWSSKRYKMTLGRAEHLDGTEKEGAFPEDADVWVELGESYIRFWGALMGLHLV